MTALIMFHLAGRLASDPSRARKHDTCIYNIFNLIRLATAQNVFRRARVALLYLLWFFTLTPLCSAFLWNDAIRRSSTSRAAPGSANVDLDCLSTPSTSRAPASTGEESFNGLECQIFNLNLLGNLSWLLCEVTWRVGHT